MESAYLVLARLADEEYLRSEASAAADDAVAAVMMRIDSAASFEGLAARIDQRIGRVLNSFAFRMATLALRSGDPAPVVHGLIAAQLAMVVDDFRDVLPSYALLYRSAEEIGADAVAVFRSTSFMRSGQWRETPAEFAEREPRAKDIAAMGMVLVGGPDGPTYQPK